MYPDHFKLRHHVRFLLILCGLYLFSGLALDSAMALNVSDITGEESEISDMGPGMQGNGELPLLHYDALSSEVIPNQAWSGDVIATITADGKPVAGEKVYFFLAADGDDSTGALFLPEYDDPGYLRTYCDMHTIDPFADVFANIVDFGRFKAIVTDANGSASFNFIRDNYINYGGLEKVLTARGSVKYYVIACVFEEPLEKTRMAGIAPEIKYYAIAPVEITSLAAVVNARAR